MKRAEIILAETRKKDTLAEVRRKRNALVSEMPSRVADEVGTVADNSVNWYSGDCRNGCFSRRKSGTSGWRNEIAGSGCGGMAEVTTNL